MHGAKSLTLALVLGAALGVLACGAMPFLHAQQKEAAAVPKDLPTYRDVVKKVLPAVVLIEATGKVGTRQMGRSPSEQLPDNLPEEFRRFFEDMQKRRGEAERTPRTFASGSGFIIDPNGLVVTNNHVVAGADSVEVKLKDGRSFVSKTIATDPKTDLAIVKVNAGSPLPYLEIGDSDAMEIGDKVLAVGAPFGLAGSVTHGIISGKGRVLGMSSDSIEDFIQTDAAINPGNSGGPVVNLAGQVIGVSTAIKSQGMGFQGVGLAIPSNMMKNVALQLAKEGTVKRGYLGIGMQDLTPDLAEKLNVPNTKGVVVVQAFPDAPAAKAGIRSGDIVTHFNGKEIDDMKALQRSVLGVPLGETATLSVLRNGEKQSVKVVMEQRPEDYGTVAMERRRPAREGDAAPASITLEKLGMDVSTSSQALAEQLGYKEAKGVIITNVEPGSLAQLAGLRRGMMIIEAERTPVDSAQALSDVVKKASLEKGLLLLVHVPNGPAQYVILRSAQ